MRIQPFIASALISIALAFFMRFGISVYARLFVFRFETIEAAWIAGAACWSIVKSAQLSPLLHRLGVVTGIRYEWLAFVALAVTPIDAIATFKAFYWFSSELELVNIILSLGCAGWSGLVRLLVIQWVTFDRLRTSGRPTPHTWPSHSAPQNLAMPTTATPMLNSVLSIVTKTPVSTLLIAQPGSGKTMTASSMGRRWVEEGHHVFYIDSKMDEKEINLWDDACSERYQFDGTLLLDPNDECVRLIEAFEQFEAFRLRHLGDGKQTICILDELPAVMAVFKTHKPNPNAVLNFINRIVNRLPSRNCHILAVTQNPSCADTLPTGTLGTLKKIIIAKAGSEAELEEWKGLTVMKPIDLSGVSSAIRNSPVDRACYYSVLQKWLPMESLIREGDYNRDTLSGGLPTHQGFTPNSAYLSDARRENAGLGAVPTHDPTHSDARSDAIIDAILAYFESVDAEPKSIGKIRGSRRMTNIRASTVEIQAALDTLVSDCILVATADGWSFPDLQQNN